MRPDLNDLAAFVAIAEERSFVRAAARLGLSPSALSHAIKTLEARVGVRLLARTTRSVATTEAGERLLQTLRPAFGEIGAGLAALEQVRDQPAGTVRLTMPKHAATSVMAPMLPQFLAAYPDIRLEIAIEERLTDIVANRFDAGIRFGENVAPGMVGVTVGPAVQTTVVGAPLYFGRHPAPSTPQELAEHRCVNYRLATPGALWPWEFVHGGRTFAMRVNGPLVFNDGDLILSAVRAGQGLGYLFEDQVADDVAAGRLVPILQEWCPAFPGYTLYHLSRRQTPAALAALIAALRDAARRR